jgi:DNA primase
MGQHSVDADKVRSIPIVRIYGLPQRPRVQHVKCPFHAERTASLALYPDNSFYCFGCRAKGRGAIDFVMQMGCDFKEACDTLMKYL